MPSVSVRLLLSQHFPLGMETSVQKHLEGHIFPNLTLAIKQIALSSIRGTSNMQEKTDSISYRNRIELIP